MSDTCPLCGKLCCCDRNASAVRRSVTKKQNLVSANAPQAFSEDVKFLKSLGDAGQFQGWNEQQQQLYQVASRLQTLLETDPRQMGVVGMACSFCGTEVNRETGEPFLITGPGISICEICIEKCMEVLNQFDAQRAAQAEQIQQAEQQASPQVVVGQPQRQVTGAPPPQAAMAPQQQQTMAPPPQQTPIAPPPQPQQTPMAPAPAQNRPAIEVGQSAPPQLLDPQRLTPEQYEAVAAELDQLLAQNPPGESAESRRLMYLSDVAEAYEAIHFPPEEDAGQKP